MNKIALTKIVCTIGPASQDLDTLERLIDGGMDIARLNFSHGSYDQHQEIINNLKEASRKSGKSIALLQDLSGPKIRTGLLEGKSVELKKGDTFTFTINKISGDEKRVSTTYQRLPVDVNPGDTILLDDGRIKLTVTGKTEKEVTCKILNGGILGEKKGMNLPGVKVSVESFTEKDVEDLKFGLENDIDYVALSFVRSAEDIRKLREVIIREVKPNKRLPIIAKIEKQEAVQSIDEIIKESDAIMVARGDLGVELPPEEVPPIQKMIVRKCNEAGIPVIIATQMLESMIENPRPTRAEASDVANAVLDGADAVMLSAETSIGKYPVEAVQTMGRIIISAESVRKERTDLSDFRLIPSADILDSIARAACVLAKQVGAKAIVPITYSGTTAFRVSKYRPAAPIVAITARKKIQRRLSLAWGVQSIHIPNFDEDPEHVFKKICVDLRQLGFVERGDYVVFTVGIPITAQESANTIKIEKVS